MEPAENDIARRVALTANDVVAANRLWTRRFRRTPAALAGPVLAGIAVWIIYLQPPRPNALGQAAIAGVLAVIVSFLLIWLFYLVAVPIAGRRAYRTTAGLRLPADYLLTPEGLSYVQEDCAAEMKWCSLVRWTADDRCLLIYNTRVTFYVLPRRLFSHAEVERIGGWLSAAGVPRF